MIRSKLTEIRKQDCADINKAIAEALAPLAEQLGLTVKIEGGKYDSLSFSPKVKFTVVATASGKSAMQAEFERYCALYQLPADAYGKTFKHRGDEYALVGIKLSRSRFPIVGRNVATGKELLFTTDSVRHLQDRPVLTPAVVLKQTGGPR